MPAEKTNIGRRGMNVTAPELFNADKFNTGIIQIFRPLVLVLYLALYF